MTKEWYVNIRNVFELAEFMVGSDQITSARELLEYFKHPEKYTEVWNLYQIEIHGVSSKSYKPSIDVKSPIPVMLALEGKKSY